MIGMLTGRVESVETDTALIDVGGVGYEVRMSATDLTPRKTPASSPI